MSQEGGVKSIKGGFFFQEGQVIYDTQKKRMKGEAQT